MASRIFGNWIGNTRKVFCRRNIFSCFIGIGIGIAGSVIILVIYYIR